MFIDLAIFIKELETSINFYCFIPTWNIISVHFYICLFFKCDIFENIVNYEFKMNIYF